MPFDEEEENNNPFESGLSEMDIPSKSDANHHKPTNSSDITTNKILLDRITIIEANKVNDGHGSASYVSFTISYNGLLIKRRYREFESFRNSLVGLFPTIIVPPIPTKQKITDIITNATVITKATSNTSNMLSTMTQSTNNIREETVNTVSAAHSNGNAVNGSITNKFDTINLIDHRKRMLTVFLNRCYKKERIRNSLVFQKFLNPNLNWQDVLNQPPISAIPKQPLQCDPMNPTKSRLLHLVMPIPTKLTLSNTLEEEEEREEDSKNDQELELINIENSIMIELDRIDKKVNKYVDELSVVSSELAILYNSFSLQEENLKNSSYLEKISTIYDQQYLSLETLYKALYLTVLEPLSELLQFSEIAKKLIKFKRKKAKQLKIINEELVRKQKSLKNNSVRYNNGNPKLNETLKKFENNEHIEDSKIVGGIANYNKFKIPGVNKLTNVFKEHIYDADPIKTHQDKINKLTVEVKQLTEMKALATEDFKILETEITKEINEYRDFFRDFEFKKILNFLIKNLLEFSRKSLENWEEYQRFIS